MNKAALIVSVMTACSILAAAQDAEENIRAVKRTQLRGVQSQAAVAAKKGGNKAAAVAAPAADEAGSSAGQEYERVQVDGSAAVKTDRGYDGADEGDAEYSADSEGEGRHPNPSAPIPAYFGALKSASAQGEKNVLFFEDEQGTIRIVHLVIGKRKTTWELVSDISRSAE